MKPAPKSLPARDRALIEAALAAGNFTVCPPCIHSRTEWDGGPMSWRQQKQAQWKNSGREEKGR